MTQTTWQEKAEIKRSQAAKKIPSEWKLSSSFLGVSETSPESVLDIPRKCGLLTETELTITENFDATALLDKLATRAFSAVEVTTAFCKRAAIAQQLTSCLTETFFDDALRRAEALDNHLATTGKPVGPLHGLPISVKDSFSIAGIPTTIGFVSFIDNPPKESNSPLIDILLAAGAVLYVKTNIPQTMMTPDSHNNIFGRVLNPHRLNITAGGSSGGEGALIAMRGSILGIGTDIAGSIRIPALCCGVVGYKPSASRVPYTGQTSSARPGFGGILPCAGPLCHSVRDAKLLLKVVFDSNAADLDDLALGVPWTVTRAKSTLRIGVMPEDPHYLLHPPMQRALKNAVTKLAAAGHDMIDLSGQMTFVDEAKKLSFEYFNMDPDKVVLGHVRKSGEPFVPSLKVTYDLEGNGPEPQLRELYDLNVARGKLLTKMRELFVRNKLDLVIGPGYQSCAVPHDTYGVPAYTVLGNLVNYPACVIPFGSANKLDDAAFVRDMAYVPDYTPEDIEGAPCHVQLIGRHMRDEDLLEDALVIEKALNSSA